MTELLAHQLDQITRVASSMQPGDDRRITLKRHARWLDRLCRRQASPGVGVTAADFALPSQHGRVVRLSDRLAGGPVILLFFRGLWCPYCSATLRAWQRQQDKLIESGASLLAISPQTPAVCAATAEAYRLSYTLLSDIGSEIASTFGLSYSIPMEIRALYLRLGVRLKDANGGDGTHLPMPATFLLDRAGIIRLADVNGDPSRRLEPASVIAKLGSLNAGSETSRP